MAEPIFPEYINFIDYKLNFNDERIYFIGYDEHYIIKYYNNKYFHIDRYLYNKEEINKLFGDHDILLVMICGDGVFDIVTF